MRAGAELRTRYVAPNFMRAHGARTVLGDNDVCNVLHFGEAAQCGLVAGFESADAWMK